MRNRNSAMMLTGLVLMFSTLAGCVVPETRAQPTAAAPAQVARPSNPGGPGPALDLKGDPQMGAQVFVNCIACHGDQGKGGVKNLGSTDGTVPSLNPIDSTIANQDPKVFAYNIDLFVEHGSTPDGPNPALKMIAWGDTKALTPQQIADVIAYVMSLNK
jgi:mono/diheme cytochrome c family protein